MVQLLHGLDGQVQNLAVGLKLVLINQRQQKKLDLVRRNERLVKELHKVPVRFLEVRVDVQKRKLSEEMEQFLAVVIRSHLLPEVLEAQLARSGNHLVNNLVDRVNVVLERDRILDALVRLRQQFLASLSRGAESVHHF